MIAGHVHNLRGMWIKTLGQEFGIPVPRTVDWRRGGIFRSTLPDRTCGPGTRRTAPGAVTDGLWQWTKRAAEAKGSG